MPETAKKADYAKSLQTSLLRLDAAIAYLNKQKIRNIVLLGYEAGANTAAWYLLKRSKAPVQAYIGISLLSFDKPKPLNGNLSLSLIRLPVLDVYAMDDRNDILQSAKRRQRLIRKHRISNPNRDPRKVRYRQLEITGANHSYSGYEDYLIKRLRSWLRVFAPGKSIIRN